MVIPLKPAIPAVWRRLALLGVLLPYLISGVSKLTDFAGAQAEVAGVVGVVGGSAVLPLTAAVIAVQLGGSVWLLRGGRLAWLGGVALAAFTLAATFLAHRWWPLPPGPDRTHAFNGFWEHIALAAALLYAAQIERRA